VQKARGLGDVALAVLHPLEPVGGREVVQPI
jgi:hypothetical protein